MASRIGASRRTAISACSISGSVTRIRVEDRGHNPMPRAAQSVRSIWLTGWRTRARLVSTVPSQEPVPLDTPIQRGEQTITEVIVRKPMAGELRGVAL